MAYNTFPHPRRSAMAVAIEPRDLTKDQYALLCACGPDAMQHPLELAGEVLRFKPNAAVNYLHRSRPIDLNSLSTVLDMTVSDHRLGLREFYRMLGYTVVAYLELFADQLANERVEEAGRS